ncbi:MAG: efflux transporter outer membrane subunit, partial [Alphaproteobacteria bacterium]|nr:efflux transporter outer membrane subunit [Alphaproteobacteria bacterium]
QRFDLGLTATYALDFWGRNKALAQAGKLSAAATRYDYETVAITTLAGLSNAYFQLLVAQDRVRLARQNIALADRILSAIRARVEAGTANALDVAQQESIVANLRASVPGLEQQLMQQRNILAVLAGRTPESTRVKGGQLRAVKLPRVRAGLPSQLLLRRPDIAAAEARLAAAGANIAAARAAFYPSFNLTADTSLESIALKNLLRPEALAASIAASALQPIFTGYTLEAQLEANKARWNQLLAAYRKSIVDALADVENALIAVRKSAEQETLRTRVVAAAQRAISITQERLREGTVDVVTLLNTQQTLFNAQDALTQARFQRLQAIVSLFQALGGGFDRQGDGSPAEFAERISRAPGGVAPAPAVIPAAAAPAGGP